MKTCTNILFAITFLLTLSCSQQNKYQQAILFSQKDFDVTQSLTGSTMSFDSTVMKPIKLQVYDSLLITINVGEEKLFHIYNLKSGKKIGERISVGQGPDEMLQPDFIKNSNKFIRIFDMGNSTLSEYNINEFIDNLNPISRRKIKLNQQIFTEVSLFNQDIISFAYGADHPFLKFNSNGEKIGEFGDYPISNISYTNKEKTDAYQFTFTSNSTDKIAICYSWTDLIEIYNKEGDLQKRIHGPAQFFPFFKEFHDGNMIIARPEKGKQRDAYFNPVSVGDDFFVLFNGKLVDEEGYSTLSNQIYVFGWDGTPKRILSLDQGIFTFTVDKENKKIYGISDNPEFHIVEFTYD